MSNHIGKTMQKHPIRTAFIIILILNLIVIIHTETKLRRLEQYICPVEAVPLSK